MQLKSRSRHMVGASLIEVLVSIVLASFALLALAGVNASSVRYTKMSQYRATAAQLANDMGERIRANKGVATPTATGFFAGNYDFSQSFASQSTAATLPSTLCDTSSSSCTPAQIAELDLAQWRILVRNQLPEGAVFLQRQSAEVAMDLWVVWRDPSVADSDESPSLAAECPDSLNRGSDLSIRCGYFRINL
jgi:type IV pilus assembly protein PilV